MNLLNVKVVVALFVVAQAKRPIAVCCNLEPPFSRIHTKNKHQLRSAFTQGLALHFKHSPSLFKAVNL